MAQIEQHRLALRRGDGVALALLMPERLAEPVARPKLHVFVARLGLGRPQPVILQIAIAILVEQEGAFAAAGLGDQNAGAGQAGRMVLNELHVAQRHAVPVGQRHAVAGHDAAIGVLSEHAAGAAGGDHHGARMDGGEFPGRQRQHHRTLDAAVIDQQIDAEILIEALDGRELGRSLEQGVENMEAAAVSGEPGALDLHAAEGAHIDVAIGLAAPWTAPMLELHHLARAMLDEIFDDVLFAQPVAAGDRVIEMVVEAVMGLHHAGRAAFRRHRVAAHRIDLRDQRDGQIRGGLGGGDRGPQAGTASTEDQDISIKMLHGASDQRRKSRIGTPTTRKIRRL